MPTLCTRCNVNCYGYGKHKKNKCKKLEWQIKLCVKAGKSDSKSTKESTLNFSMCGNWQATHDIGASILPQLKPSSCSLNWSKRIFPLRNIAP